MSYLTKTTEFIKKENLFVDNKNTLIVSVNLLLAHKLRDEDIEEDEDGNELYMSIILDRVIIFVRELNQLKESLEEYGFNVQISITVRNVEISLNLSHSLINLLKDECNELFMWDMVNKGYSQIR